MSNLPGFSAAEESQWLGVRLLLRALVCGGFFVWFWKVGFQDVFFFLK